MKKLIPLIAATIFSTSAFADSGFGALFYILKNNELLSYEDAEVRIASNTRISSQQLETRGECSVSFLSETSMGENIHVRDITVDFSKIDSRGVVFETLAGIVYQVSFYDLDDAGAITESFTIQGESAGSAASEYEVYVYTKFELDASASSKGNDLRQLIDDLLKTCD